MNQFVEIPESKARWLKGLLSLALVLFIIGISTPMLTMTKFVFIESEFSVLFGAAELFSNGQFVLFFVIAGFSIVLPLMKIGVLYRLLSIGPNQSPMLGRYLNLMHEYGRWAMLDVMVVAILIVIVKLGVVATIEVHYGLFVFGGAVLLIMLLTNRVVALTTDKQSE